MWIVIVKTAFVYFHIITLVSSTHNECSDPNAELRSDNANCVLTCKKRSILENPSFCFQKPTLREGCYCKQGYYLEEITKKCVNFQDCRCNTTNKELSRFSNECGNNCATFHTPCPNLLRGQCWCDSLYCKDANGICILKEIAE